MRKIAVVTGSRAEYGLLQNLLERIKTDKNLDLQLIATGMHLSPEFGLTYKLIEEDGFFINKKIEILLSSDTPIGISKSVGLAMVSFSEAYSDLNPDFVVVLGDRFEIYAAAVSAHILRIPIVHIHGGETTEGAVDEAFRHSITKMAHLHFAAIEEYRKRIIQLGEDPRRVFTVGALGIDAISKLKLLPKDELESEIKFKFGNKNLLVTFHSVTLEKATARQQFGELLKAIDCFQDVNIVFTKTNADTEGRIINDMIDDYVCQNRKRSIAFASMGQLKYLSTLQFVDGVVGNSSSGILEVPYFKIGTVNIGDRQKGRVAAESVIICLPEKASIVNAIKKIYSDAFQELLNTFINPYGKVGASERIMAVLKPYQIENDIKKSFYDVDFNVND